MNIEIVKLDSLENFPIEVKNQMLTLGFSEQQFKSETLNALQIWNNPKSEYLRKCDKGSFLTSLVNLCKIGLSLNPVKKEAYLVPRAGKVCLEPSYIGLIKLLTDEGTVKNIQTNVIYENCTFDLFHDMNGLNFKHIPYYVKKLKPGEIAGVYCIANLSNGEKQFEHMTIDELNDIKEKSESYKSYVKRKKTGSTIWVDYESEMIRKTIIRRIYKYLPRSNSSNTSYINEAVKLDESAFSATNEQILYIENLLHTSILDEDQKQQIESEYVIMNSSDAKKCINYLQNNQRESDNKSQTEILNELNIISKDDKK